MFHKKIQIQLSTLSEKFRYLCQVGALSYKPQFSRGMQPSSGQCAAFLSSLFPYHLVTLHLKARDAHSMLWGKWEDGSLWKGHTTGITFHAELYVCTTLYHGPSRGAAQHLMEEHWWSWAERAS